MTSPAFLTPPECAKLLRCRQSKIVGDIRSGRLPTINLSEGQRPRYRIKRSDLDAYLDGFAVVPVTRPERKERRAIPQHCRV